MASKVGSGRNSNDTITAHPSWNAAQRKFFERLKEGLPVVMSYLAGEIPVMDNHTLNQIVDETGVLKQLKKPVETAEKTHVERLRVRMAAASFDEHFGNAYRAYFQGSKRVILNQEACKAFIAQANEMQIHLGRLLEAVANRELAVPNSVFLHDEVPANAEVGTQYQPPEFNDPNFFTTAEGGRALYVKPIGE